MKNGGGKGDIKALLSQEILLQNRKASQTTSGHLTPGTIAQLENIQLSFYPSMDSFMSTLQQLIAQNQQEYPPQEGEEQVIPGPDFWSSKYLYKHKGACVEESSSLSSHNLSKQGNITVSGASASSLGHACASLTDELAMPAIDDGKEIAKEAKLQEKKKAALEKKNRVALKLFCQLVNTLSKCRSEVLIKNKGIRFSQMLSKVEQEAQPLQPQDGDELEQLAAKMERIQGCLDKLYKEFPGFAPKQPPPKKARIAVDSRGEEEEAAMPEIVIKTEPGVQESAAEQEKAAKGRSGRAQGNQEQKEPTALENAVAAELDKAGVAGAATNEVADDDDVILG